MNVVVPTWFNHTSHLNILEDKAPLPLTRPPAPEVWRSQRSSLRLPIFYTIPAIKQTPQKDQTEHNTNKHVRPQLDVL